MLCRAIVFWPQAVVLKLRADLLGGVVNTSQNQNAIVLAQRTFPKTMDSSLQALHCYRDPPLQFPLFILLQGPTVCLPKKVTKQNKKNRPSGSLSSEALQNPGLDTFLFLVAWTKKKPPA